MIIKRAKKERFSASELQREREPEGSRRCRSRIFTPSQLQLSFFFSFLSGDLKLASLNSDERFSVVQF